jgi:hypothetical protein
VGERRWESAAAESASLPRGPADRLRVSSPREAGLRARRESRRWSRSLPRERARFRSCPPGSGPPSRIPKAGRSLSPSGGAPRETLLPPGRRLPRRARAAAPPERWQTCGRRGSRSRPSTELDPSPRRAEPSSDAARPSEPLRLPRAPTRARRPRARVRQRETRPPAHPKLPRRGRAARSRKEIRKGRTFGPLLSASPGRKRNSTVEVAGTGPTDLHPPQFTRGQVPRPALPQFI